MSITIKPIVQGKSYQVNEKEVYLDVNNNWIVKGDDYLESKEQNAFNNYKRSVINSQSFAIHTEGKY